MRSHSLNTRSTRLAHAARRRDFLAGSAAAGTLMLLHPIPALAQGKPMKNTFTILHTNDIHSNLIGVGPACRE